MTERKETERRVGKKRKREKKREGGIPHPFPCFTPPPFPPADDGTYVSCDHCGIAWFWTLSEQELECLQVACTNPEGQLMMAQDYIRGGGSNPCAIYFG